MNKEPAHLRLVSDLLIAISKYSKAAKREVTGNSVIERAEKETPMIVMWAAYPNGNFLCWFADEGKMHLYTMQEGKLKKVISVLVTEMGKLQDAINKVTPKLYPRKKKK